MSVLYDYLEEIAPDSTAEFEIIPQDILMLSSVKESEIHEGFGTSNEEIISFSDSKKYFFNLQFNLISKTDFEYIFDFFNDSSKADGNVMSFHYTPNNQFDSDSDHTYVCRFNQNTLNGFLRNYKIYGYSEIQLKILGKKLIPIPPVPPIPIPGIFVSEWNNFRVQKFDTNGNYLLKWGTFGAGNGEFDRPEGMRMSGTSIFVADSDNNRIQEFDFDGNFLAIHGSSGSGDGQFDYPMDLVVDDYGYFYVVDSDNSRIQKFDSSWNYIDQWGNFGAGNGQFRDPRGIGVDSYGNIYVVDLLNWRVQKFDSDGNFILKWGIFGFGNGEFNWPFDLAINSSNHIYVTDQILDRIQKFDSNGNFIESYGWGAGDIPLDEPSGIDVDDNDNIFVVDSNNDRILKFNSTWNLQNQWGSSGNGNGEFDYPIKIIVR